MAARLIFENDRVRVLRVRHEGRERHPHTSRNDRLIIYLNSGHVKRTENDKEEEIRHEAGDVVWSDASEHQIDNLNESGHEVIIVEVK